MPSAHKSFNDIFDIDDEMTLSLRDAIAGMSKAASEHSVIRRARIPAWTCSIIKTRWKELKANYQEIQKTAGSFEELIPAVKWINDNYYAVSRVIIEIRGQLRRRNRKALPQVACSDGVFLPRLFLLVKEIMKGTGCHFRENELKVLLEAYQNLKPLTISELWLMPVMIKIFYLDAISKISAKALDAVRLKNKAEKMIRDVLDENKGKNKIIEEITRLIRDMPSAKDPDFLSHIIYKLKERGINDENLLDSVTRSVYGPERTYHSVIRREADKQSGLISRAAVLITGLNNITDLDWLELFQDISVVDEILSDEACGVYGKMDFQTRNRYRSRIERVSGKVRQEEFYIAKKVLDMTRGKEGKKAHVGYYLIGEGRSELYADLDYRLGPASILREFITKNKKKIYFSLLFSSSLLLAASATLYTYMTLDRHRLLLSALFAVPLLILAVSMTGDILNSVYLRLLSIKQPPRMDYEKGIPDDCRTVVAIPVLISGIKDVERYAGKLEQSYLSNREANLFFAILADFHDSDVKENETEKTIDSYAEKLMMKLNKTYFTAGDTRFFYLSRDRKWNEKDGVWMGWERKRGKLIEFNRLLLGCGQTSFRNGENIGMLAGKIKYVITIDSDTDLVSGSAHKLVGTLAHILNRPELSRDGRRIIGGYALMQPRIDTRLESYLKTPFSRMFSGRIGIDPYAYAASDIYQDLFEEGSFVGKGIYDLEYFNKVLDGKIPDNSVLSHDLLEGSYARSGLSSDIQLVDGHPANVLSFYKREHRWIRGDWQLLPWLFGRGRLHASARWKMLSNLIRSLTPAAFLIYLAGIPLLLGWDMLAYLSVVLLTAALAVVPAVTQGLKAAVFKTCAAFCIKATFLSISKTLGCMLFMTAILPFRAHVALDAVIRTLFRMAISKKKLLEWETAEKTEMSLTGKPAEYIRKMFQNIVAGAFALYSGTIAGNTVLYALGALFLLAPAWSYIAGLPIRYKRPMLSSADKDDLYAIARKTWRYFDEFFDAEYNYLIPDNYQMLDEETAATRTSPTNIGLQLMAFLSARDFGFISISSFFSMVDKTLGTVGRLKKWHGNLYNWYDITSLEPLAPHYISSVDSGNFVSYLMTLKQGILDIVDNPVFSMANLKGIKDVMAEAGFEASGIDELDYEKITDFIKDAVSDIDNRDNSWINRQYSAFARNDLIGYLKDLDNFRTLGKSLAELCRENNRNALIVRQEIDGTIKKIDFIVRNTRLNMLYDRKKNLFHIGYNVDRSEPDNSYYDLLASEARTTGFIAISKNEVPRKHWRKLSRPMILVNGHPVLLSWNGTMFEYFMPHLIMKPLRETIFCSTLKGVVKAQIRYAKKRGVPFGVSESAYYRFDSSLNYQYRAFGIPQLGFRSDLRKYLTIAPYASIMAIEEYPEEVIRNLYRIRQLGGYGRFGFYDAIDYLNPSTTAVNKPKIVKTFMCHHQGMILMALDNFLHFNIHRERFHRDPFVKSNEFILEETRLIGRFVGENVVAKTPEKMEYRGQAAEALRIIRDTCLNYPVTHIMSNDVYQIMLDSDGGGFSKYRDRYINIWDKDWTGNDYGNFVYIKNITKGTFYSAAYKPTLVEPESYEVCFYPDKAEYTRMDGGIETRMEVVAMTNLNGEIRRIRTTNKTNGKVRLEITNYIDIIIDRFASFSRHPAFSKLFIETEFDQHHMCVIAARRQKTLKEPSCCFGAVCIPETAHSMKFEYDTDRSRFIGRGRSAADPNAMDDSYQFKGTAGEVVEPCIAMKASVELDPGEKKTVSFVYLVSEKKEGICEVLSSFRSADRIQDKFTKALYDSRLEMSYLGLDYSKANAVLDAAAFVIYSLDLFRAGDDIIRENDLSQKSLWKYGISGDSPVVLVLIEKMDDVETLRDSIILYEYLRSNRTDIDLVVVSGGDDDYRNEMSSVIGDILHDVRTFEGDRKSRGVFWIKRSKLQEEEFTLLLTSADMILKGEDRILGTKIKEARERLCRPSYRKHIPFDEAEGYRPEKADIKKLRFYNGYGGFDTVNDEYVICLHDGKTTPMPWINVIANRYFGCLVSESGMGYTYNRNSGTNKLTKWSNDPVIDDAPEIIYVQDGMSRDVFTVSPAPARRPGSYVIRHGYGYTEYQRSYLGLKMRQLVFVPVDKCFKYIILTIENTTGHERELNIAYYAELVLGEERAKNMKYIYTEADKKSRLLKAVNRYNERYGHHAAYLYCNSEITDYTCDKDDFIGKIQQKGNPEGMISDHLQRRTGGRLNACFALKTSKTLSAGRKTTIVFMLGQEQETEDLKDIVKEFGNMDRALLEYKKMRKFWDEKLSVIKVNTPDEKMNVMLNGWLTYQTIACRIMARAAFYQAGGAYGFRDQLQDSMALLYSMPETARELMLNAARHQFTEGDVQHWWHPDTGIGIRTRISDDMLWLPYVLCCYISVTGDRSVLDEEEHYLVWDELLPNEDERYGKPDISPEKGSVYEHARKAILYAMKTGAHGLPLIGTGDWNDGLNSVGDKGKGESVWLGWFLYATIMKFREIAVERADQGYIDRADLFKETLKRDLDENAWDGEWYLRAFFDDGTKLGSREQSECRIDLISQAWSVISGAGDEQKARKAMASAKKHLIDEHEKMIYLLTPPFHRSRPNPGYIQGYLRGVRENGGQYTHAAVWAVYAYSILGDADMAFMLYDMLNPISHTEKANDTDKYKLEPYAVCADIYNNELQKGRGGWSFYTGSSSWMYKAGLEELLGFKKRGNALYIEPRLPEGFDRFSIEYLYGKTKYTLHVKLTDDAPSHEIRINDVKIEDDHIPLSDDGMDRIVFVNTENKSARRP